VMVTACQGEAHALPSRCVLHWVGADRVLQQLADPVRALGEMVSVTRPGGRGRDPIQIRNRW
jgi:hypothetical protein